MNLHQHFEFGPASQDPLSFFQIQLALDTVLLGNRKFELIPKTAKKTASSLHFLVPCALLFHVLDPDTAFVEKDKKRKIQGSTPPFQGSSCSYITFTSKIVCYKELMIGKLPTDPCNMLPTL